MGIASYFRTRKASPDEARNSAAFREVALPQLGPAYRLARWLTRNHEDAEEIVQEAYLSAFRHFDGYRGGDPRSWILTIVRNTYYSSLRQHQPAAESFDEEAHGAEDCEAASGLVSGLATDRNPESILSQRQNMEMVQKALEELPVDMREVLVLRMFDELTYNEIATITNIPLGTVMSRLARARLHLAKRLKPMNPEWK
ncbi:sigma-70 family RNA polymerase sigma factor [Noviherbaspirillum massiliense]|uniref:sigma-70 family RNA polymerase sigma factor n=1 Tax=Noviherbaspirillum massiliense TaxID=1465823 RepID=UPI0002E1292C|nr:sigma-70 family RNA polymerase sigma factor [Noviherbaspirillum massiliense]